MTTLADQVELIAAKYDPSAAATTADALRALWLGYEPESIAVIKAEQREQQEMAGIPVDVLRSIGRELAKGACKHIDSYVPLSRLLWESYGREGRVVAVYVLGAMELVEPDTILPLLRELCRTCITWEDADQMAMRAVEPIVCKAPDEWLATMEPWLEDANKWVRRAGATVVGRLPMKHPAYTQRCVAMVEGLLGDSEMDVKRAVSFALRLSARGQVEPVRELLERRVRPQDPAATWVLCDVIRSMARKLMPEFASLLPLYERWAANPDLSARDRRSVGGAIKALQRDI